MSEVLRILILAANPIDTNELALKAEHRLLRNKLADNAELGNCELLFEWSARLPDLLLKVATHKPHVLHFAGHGTRDGICLEDDAGKCSPVSKSQLAEVFKALGGHLRLVVLNSCFSALQAEAISQSVDYVVGTTAAVPDDVALRFAAYFYEALALGKTVREAHFKSQSDLAFGRREPIGEYELLVRASTDEGEPLLPPMLPPVKENILDLAAEDGIFGDVEFVNVIDERPGDDASTEHPGRSERNVVRQKFKKLKANTAIFTNKHYRK